MEGADAPGKTYHSGGWLGDWWYANREGMYRGVFSTVSLKITDVNIRTRAYAN